MVEILEGGWDECIEMDDEIEIRLLEWIQILEEFR